MTQDKGNFFTAVFIFLVLGGVMILPFVYFYLSNHIYLAWMDHVVSLATGGLFTPEIEKKIGVITICFLAGAFTIQVIKLIDWLTGSDLYSALSITRSIRKQTSRSLTYTPAAPAVTRWNRTVVKRKSHEVVHHNHDSIDEMLYRYIVPTALYTGFVTMPIFIGPVEWAVKMIGSQPFGIPDSYIQAGIFAIILLPLFSICNHAFILAEYFRSLPRSRFNRFISKYIPAMPYILLFFYIRDNAPVEMLKRRRSYGLSVVYFAMMLPLFIYVYLTYKLI